VFRLLPVEWRAEILEGILGADLVGFHTYEYVQHFLQSVLRILGREHHMGRIVSRDRVVRADTFPLGIDFDRFAEAARDPAVLAERKSIRASMADVRMVVSVDRLDYTKGIINRLQGFEVLLTRHPELLGTVALVMIVVPSRTEVDQYASMKKQIEEMVGGINGRFGRVGWTPVVYQYKQLSFERLVALYSLSDVGLVTPLRDGMNLVAKEYVASRTEETGVLILSEMAGAVKELGEAIVVNPNNRREIGAAMYEALTLPVEEQRARMKAMRARLRRYTALRWAEDFVTDLEGMKEIQAKFHAKVLDEAGRLEILSSARKARRRLFLLDYDGTLVPIERRPELAKPGEAVLDLLKDLVVDDAHTVVVISGRDRGTLDAWLGRVPVDLVAEHGVWVRFWGKEWRMLKNFSSEWKEHLQPILQHYVDRVPGTFVEEKEHSLVWHYRQADPDQARMTAAELTDNLMTFTANIDVHILQGNKVVEIRNAGVNKGSATGEWIARGEFDFILAIGDDWTDEDLFAALPPSAFTLRVGVTRTRASYNVRDQQEVISLLQDLTMLRNYQHAPASTAPTGHDAPGG